MEKAPMTHAVSAPSTTASTFAPATVQVSRNPQAVVGKPIVHVVHPDVWVLEKSQDSFWSTQAPPLAAVLGVLIAVVVKWIWDSRDRQYRLKRGLYLELSDAITECINVFVSFASSETPIKELSDRLVKAFAVFVKVEVVANDEMLGALGDLKDLSDTVYHQVMRERIAMERHRAAINVNEPFIRQYQNDIDYVLAEQKRMNIEGINNPDRFSRLKRQYEFANGQLTELNKKTKEHLIGINALTMQIAEIVLDRQLELVPAIERVRHRMRKDLGFKYDFDSNVARQLAIAKRAREKFTATEATVKDTFMPDSAEK